MMRTRSTKHGRPGNHGTLKAAIASSDLVTYSLPIGR